MKLFVGLGNPGSEYARNRHNVGFLALDRIAARHGFSPWRKKFSGLSADGMLGDEKVVLLKPETYMNDSGRAVGEACRFHKIGIDDVIVFHDELDLAPARIRVKTGGGNAGHNGLRSITALVGNETQRVRIGIGHPGAKELVHGWVLSNFAKSDHAWLVPLLDAIANDAPHLAAGQPERFQTDVARATQGDTAPESVADSEKRVTRDPEASPKAAQAAASHPRGERSTKQQNALAENLKKWFAGKRGGS